MRPHFRLTVAVSALLLFVAVSAYAKKPEVTKHDAQYLDRAVKINIQWQSTEPVVSVKVAAGREAKEIKVDPYSNKRNPYGYAGEEDVVLQTDPSINQEVVPYSIQIEDEDGQRSVLVTGEVKIPGMARKPQDDQWGKEKMTGPPVVGQQQQQGDMIDKLRQVAAVLASPPVLQDVKVNNPGSGTVTFKTKATHSVGLKEVDFRVFDSGNKQVDTQQIAATGTLWEGTSKDFTLQPGNYFVIAQAIDGTGSTSPERKAFFTIKGTAVQPPQPQPAQPQPVQPQPDQSPQSQPAQLQPAQPQPPQLIVTIQPQEVLDKGPQWRTGGGDWKNHGDNVPSGLAVGWSDVEFKDVPGWTKPDVQKASIEAGKTATVTGIYVPDTKDSKDKK